MPNAAPHTATTLADAILAGHPRAIARGISLVENNAPEATDLLKRMFPHTGRARVIGLTGAPGAGKSSLTDKLAQVYVDRGQRVGIVAVDPSSPFSGGAILGDRIRMPKLATHPRVFIRSMATRGNLGGLARATTEAVLLLDAAGYDVVIVETVGVGQDEVDIVKTADVTAVVVVPGMGDDVQSIKAGIMEIGDVFVINKADRDGVERTQLELEALLELAVRPDGWHPPIVRTIATATPPVGLEALAEALDSYLTFVAQHPDARARRRQQILEQRLVELIRDQLLRHAWQRVLGDGLLKDAVARIANRELDPYTLADYVVQRVLK
ncbi:MAG: methylmalonyl Co-A mutase-associated GTPase MeaB [Chloracidobacterium sp.]|uniref:Methylmalonyl Co-A mutase-associated GTPase MeaB n=1 Tax=Chloracidobacterium validum TaxID=2821543 RepID=A0ABX8B800_9BACT|nr:methylmalonyl Co-A mutase-associated GTPase MeaB [Chloracidobacterium validum]QUW03084.1 methylmalonyl Co-A mutase-associated GTPase MeaB [Chloracidobacterium validum]